MSSEPQASNQGAPSFAESIIGVFSNGACCKRRKNKVNPVAKKEESKSEKKSSNSHGIQRSPTPGPEGRSKDSEPSATKQKSLEVDSEKLKPDESSVTALAGSVEENLPEQVSSKVDIEIVEPIEEESKNLEKSPSIEEPQTQLSSTSSLRPLRPDGAGVRSSGIRSGTISRNPFPEYEGSSHLEHFSNESVCSIRELEEDELDIDDWGEGFQRRNRRIRVIDEWNRVKRTKKREAVEMEYQMARGEIYENPSEVSHPGEPSTKRNSQLGKEEYIFDNPITNDSNDDANDSRQFSSIAKKDRNVQHIWRGKTTNQN
ncbi:unnamed protein product [Caenorhabditis nigoni]